MLGIAYKEYPTLCANCLKEHWRLGPEWFGRKGQTSVRKCEPGQTGQ